jgi:hypothetical protein
METVLKLYNVITDAELPDMSVSELPSDGDPLEIAGELYFVCERDYTRPDIPLIGVIPLIVKNPSRITNIDQYLKCLSKAHRRVQYRHKINGSESENSEEIIIY